METRKALEACLSCVSTRLASIERRKEAWGQQSASCPPDVRNEDNSLQTSVEYLSDLLSDLQKRSVAAGELERRLQQSEESVAFFTDENEKLKEQVRHLTSRLTGYETEGQRMNEMAARLAELESAKEEKDLLESKMKDMEELFQQQTNQQVEEAKNASSSQLEALSQHIEVLSKELKAEKRSREAMEVRLQASISKDQHNDIVNDLQARLRSTSERMVGLDQKFKQLWQQMKGENAQIRDSAQALQREVAEEREKRVREEERARVAVQQQKALDQRVKMLERDIMKLRNLVKSIKEQSQILRTIARIRTETSRDSEEAVGFDALVKTIDNIHKEVERQCRLSL